MSKLSNMIPLVLLDKVINFALEEDFGIGGDLTSNATIPSSLNSSAEIVTRSKGTIAGLEVAQRVFNIIDSSLDVNLTVEDGDVVESNVTVMRISGKSISILGAERTALNFLGILSGVASETRKLVDAIKGTNANICCTRKTIPGLRLLQKYAVKCGGGLNHRFGLGDGILIKDNHIYASNGMENAIKSARSICGHTQKIEVEIERLDQILPAIQSGADIIMLDNMKISDMEKAVNIINKQAFIEASGSVNIDNVRAIAETGVDIISVGWITHSAPSLDVGLDFCI